MSVPYNYNQYNNQKYYRNDYNNRQRSHYTDRSGSGQNYDNRRGYGQQQGYYPPQRGHGRNVRGYAPPQQSGNYYNNKGRLMGRDREDRKDEYYNNQYNKYYTNQQRQWSDRRDNSRGYRGGYRGGRGGHYGGNSNNYNTGGGYNIHNSRLLPKKAIDDNFNYDAKDWKDNISKPEIDERVKTEDVQPIKGVTFDEWSLNKKLLRAIYELGFESPSPVQEEAIPQILQRKNVLARAKNGTGKTGAYAIPIVQLIEPNKKTVQALILTPTRELALQTSKVFIELTKYLDIQVICATGGTPLRDDIIRLQHKPQIVVATPGRLIDLARSGNAKLQGTGIVAIDEADKLLSLDFQQLIEHILEYIPERLKDKDGDPYDRQLLLFSATFPSTVKGFCEKYLKQVTRINLMEDLTLKGISQYYAYLNEKQKVHALYSLVKKLEINQCVIFAKSVTRVELLARKLQKLGFECFYIHSRMDQEDRKRVFHEFRQGGVKARYLVCTDLITRGVDYPQVNVVINFDFPKTGETYLHRIGRGGRFGHLALAINFVTDIDRDRFYQVEHHLQTEIKPIPNDVATIDKTTYAS